MAQTITIANATYPDVPSIVCNKSGGGTAVFADPSVTTATASDVAQGKLFLDAAGILTTGTASGGSGGASNVVQGTFKGTTAGSVLQVPLNYSGSGYPIAVSVWPTEGGYNVDGDFYKTLQRYAICTYFAVKCYPATAPTYPTSGSNNTGTANLRLSSKSSASTAQTLTSSGNSGYMIWINTNPSASGNGFNAVHVRSNTRMDVYIASTSYGFMKDIEYKFCVVYSS